LRYFYQIFIFFCLLPASIISQVNSFIDNDIENTLQPQHEPFFHKARLSFESDQWSEAIPNLDSLLKYYPTNSSILYLSGIARTQKVSQKKIGLNHLWLSLPAANFLPDWAYWLGYTYELNDSIPQAMKWYRNYIEQCQTGLIAHCIRLDDAKRQESNLISAHRMKNYLNLVNIKNIGSPINTEADEYVPLVPSDESFMIFTYRGKLSKGGKQDVTKGKVLNTSKKEEKIYFEDVFISTRLNDTAWSVPVPIKSINTNLHDAAVTLSSDGTMLFIYKNIGKGNGDLYMSKLVGNSWSIPKFQRGLNSDKWEGSAAFFPDNQRIIFSSERKGGFGGKDLYMAELIGEDTWGNIVNLGSTVNTSYDEDAPFITADGRTLLFSSNGKLSTGGYDILRSDWTGTEWGSPYNIGKPINTSSDDKFYLVTADGKKGYYSSVKEDGFGGQDIYSIEPGLPGKPFKLVQISGIVHLNGKPSLGNIQVNILNNQKFKPQVYQSNSSSGKFLMNLPEGQDYELVFSCNELPLQKKYINTMNIDSFIPVQVIADFYTEDYLKKLEAKMDSLSIVDKKNSVAGGYEDFAIQYGNLVVDSLFFKIQIGAYKFIENFNYTKTMHLGKIIRKVYEDGITRFTVGNYTSFNEAFKVLQDIKSHAIKDAFVIAVYKNEYYYLEKLVKGGILIK